MKRSHVMVGVGIFLAVVSIWFGVSYYVWRHMKDAAEAGQFGDTFGAVNALFSALAFVGVVVAIFLQTEELRHTREAAEDESKSRNESRANELRTAKLNALTALLQSVDSTVARLDNTSVSERNGGTVVTHFVTKGLGEALAEQKDLRKKIEELLTEM